MFDIDYKVMDLAKDESGREFVIATAKAAYKFLVNTAKEYRGKGYEVKLDERTVRCWNPEHRFERPEVYYMMEAAPLVIAR